VLSNVLNELQNYLPPWMLQDVCGLIDGCSRETQQGMNNVRGMVANSPTMDNVDGNAKMLMAPNSVQWKSQDSECFMHGVRRQDQ
jgi:hypothetical protein